VGTFSVGVLGKVIFVLRQAFPRPLNQCIDLCDIPLHKFITHDTTTAAKSTYNPIGINATANRRAKIPRQGTQAQVRCLKVLA
jgi:hypothetical protein